MKPLYWRSVKSKDADRPRPTYHHRGEEINEMTMEKWWSEICGMGKQEKPREKPTQTQFDPSQNPLGATETRTRDPRGVGGE